MNLVRVAALALLIAMPAQGMAAPKSRDANSDPDREICKSVSVVGSRLKRVRECHTAQEWEELKLQERVGLMRKQYNGSPGCRGCDGMTKDSPW